MDDQISPASSSGSLDRRRRRRPLPPSAGEEQQQVAWACQSCTAGVIGDCVAMCCCPCAVVNILALAFVKLPWAVARRYIGRRRGRRRMAMEGDERRKCRCEVVVEEAGTVVEEFRCGGGSEEVWVELFEFGHLGFGRVSFTGIPSQPKGNLGNS